MKMHHVSPLFLHPSRRIRQLTADLHKSFVLLMKEAILAHFNACSTREAEWILGSWCMAAHDTDRGVAASALSSWRSFTEVSGQQLLNDKENGFFSCLAAFVYRAAMDPLAIYLDLNPLPPAPPPPTKGASKKVEPEPTPRLKSEDLEEDEQDRKARIRVGAYGAIRWIIGKLPLLSIAPFNQLGHRHCRDGTSRTAFKSYILVGIALQGVGAICPSRRRMFWVRSTCRSESSLGTCSSSFATFVPSFWIGLIVLTPMVDPIQTQLSTLSAAILHSAWVEPDTTVHTVMWQPLLRFLKGEDLIHLQNNLNSAVADHSNAWELADRVSVEGDGSSDEEDEERHPPLKTRPAYDEFLQFLQLGCSGSPIQGYPTVVIIISTIPSSVSLAATGIAFDLTFY